MKRFLILAATALLALAALLAWANRPYPALPEGVRIDKIVVHKADRRMVLLERGRPVATYPISLGGQPVGPKQREGDERTPEGLYVIDYHKPDSAFHRSLHISYPNRADAERAHAAGEDPGGLIMIHGLPPPLSFVGRLHRLLDWTNGCVAVTNADIEQIYGVVADGTPVELLP